ncbi:HK97-gp10 family putative phage morphogenesis protein [Rhizobium rhizogenes]|uniref:HK97-gp10 family putative phage morphogenesis protein n=1 Tax=Rhizobium rhizogenes TaxID=359 RepID=UPI0015720D2E|nr:HK97-gp10 family putative phage morphogenesis protein [Rhizobium rhizogenes]NTI41604.1 HK97 gp10 family phage protein [Rhizobium rhizogenes]
MADDGGLSRFQQRMKAIPKAVREAVVPALSQAAHELADDIEHLAPENTGKLKNSIAVTPPGQSTPAYSVPGGSQVAGPTEALVTAGDSDVRYAHLVEYGTPKAHAQPFFWPAVRLNSKRVSNRIKRAIGTAVRKNWGSGK